MMTFQPSPFTPISAPYSRMASLDHVEGPSDASFSELYGRIPPVECRGECIDSCGPISMSVAEAARIEALGVSIPTMAQALTALAAGEDYYCPALRDGRCSVYDARPTICRLWGATESMPCPHGCGPAVPLTQEQSHGLLRESAELGGGMVDAF
jgi:hypothetical protein